MPADADQSLDVAPLCASTIRRVEFPRDVQAMLRYSLASQKHTLPVARECVYKFAASVEELQYVARRLVRDNISAMELQAPPGVGKTTKFPLEISKMTRDCVVVLEPTENLARAQCATLVRGGSAATYVPMTAIDNFWPWEVAGVVFMTPATFLVFARLMQLHPERYSPCRRDVILLHDECHENDGSTYVLRALWSTFAIVRKYVMMSATTGGNRAEARQRHNSAQPLVIKKFPPIDEAHITIADVTPDGKWCPWAINSVANKRVLMFVEDDNVAKELLAAYKPYVPARMLRRGDSYAAYEEVCAALKVVTSVLVIVDSGYQTGYTFNVEEVIDMGLRRQTGCSDDAKPVDKYRLVTAGERRQRIERAGRFRPGVAHIPDEPVDDRTSVLAPGELGHAAAWFLLMGYTVPADLPVPSIDRLQKADWYKLLASGLPWPVWNASSYSTALVVDERIHWSDVYKFVSANKDAEAAANVSREVGPQRALGDVTRAATDCRVAAVDCVVSNPPACDSAEPSQEVTVVSWESSLRKRLQEIAGAELPESLRERNLGTSGRQSDKGCINDSGVGVQDVAGMVSAVDNLRWAEAGTKPSYIQLRSGTFYETLAGFPGPPPGVLDRLLDQCPGIQRWLYDEIVKVPPDALRRATAADKMLKWSVWLTAWNANEAEATVSRYSVTRAPVPYRSGVTVYCERPADPEHFNLCARRRQDLREWYSLLMRAIPMQLLVADGSRYIATTYKHKARRRTTVENEIMRSAVAGTVVAELKLSDLRKARRTMRAPTVDSVSSGQFEHRLVRFHKDSKG